MEARPSLGEQWREEARALRAGGCSWPAGWETGRDREDVRAAWPCP